jgi:sugar phosphate permease
MIARLARGPLFYGWIIVAVTFVAMLAAAGVRSVPGILILPLESEFQWDRATLSFAIAVNLFLFGFCAPFAASIMERVGMRAMMLFSLTTIGVAAALTTLMSQPWHLVLLWGVAVGLGAGALSGWLQATVANRWFQERRGVVVGILTAAFATGQLVFLPLLASIVASIGWRPAVWLTVAVLALVLLPVAVFIRSHPQELGLRPFGAGPETSATVVPPKPTGNPFGTALGTLGRGLRNRDFLLLAGTFFICGASTNGLIGTHLIPASIEHGIPEVAAAGFLALIGVFDIVGTMVSGWLSDRYDNRWLLFWYYGLRGLSLLFLPFAFGTGWFGLALFVVFYGLDWVATVPPTVRLAADLFGKQNVGRVFAWIFASHQLGAAGIAYGAGALRLWLGDYQAAFMFSGLLCLVAAGMAMRIGGSAARRALPAQPPAGAATPAGD